MGVVMFYEIEYCCLSHIGKCRSANQDNFFCRSQFLNHENTGTDRCLRGTVSDGESAAFSVFDGMGGEEAGEMAAYLAARTMADHPLRGEPVKAFAAYCSRANGEICNYLRRNGLMSMGTTMAALQFHRRGICLCNIGDSKVLRLSKGQPHQISQDHVAVAAAGMKPPLTQNLGIPETELLLAPYIVQGRYRADDQYLICSDGLTDMVSMEEIEAQLRMEPRQNVVERLLKLALDRGGRDNITMIHLTVQRKTFFRKRK